MTGIMFYQGNVDTLVDLKSIPGKGWFPYYWRPGKTPPEIDDKVLLDERWSIACIIDGKEGRAMSRRDFLLLARP